MFQRNEILPLLIVSYVTVLLASAVGVAQHHEHHDERALNADPRLSPGQLAPVLVGLGKNHHPVTTQSERAQLFFDQGLRLAYGFNHQEALRAFKEAARLDPDCAMAYWGWAYVLGPNLNLAMQAEAVSQAWEAAQLAIAHSDHVSEIEQDYIRAIAARYSSDPKADRAVLDLAYAEAMREVHEKYPNDADAATLYAEALMTLSPWDYWTPDGQPKEQTPAILATLEKVLEADPYHQGALHFYIHAVEAVDPFRGEAAADRLRGLAPGAGHLVHMPSHIYMQTGRYADAYEVNVLASQADESYITQCRAQGIYPLTYYPHNLHFLNWAAMMLGKSREALAISRKVAAQVPGEKAKEDAWGIYQTFLSQPLYAMVRFGRWEEILAEPAPAPELRFYRGIHHYARALAFVNTGNMTAAAEEQGQLEVIVRDLETAKTVVGFANAQAILDIALETVKGELAAREKRFEEAIPHLERAVRLQEGLRYTEPPDWYYPARQNLGAVLLDAGRAGEAETVFWRDLQQYPKNGFSLFGLWQSLRAQGRESEAASVEEQFRQAWVYADTQLRSARF